MIFVIGNSHTEMLAATLRKCVPEGHVRHIRFGPTKTTKAEASEILRRDLGIVGSLNAQALFVAAEQTDSRFLICMGGNAHFLFAHRELDPPIAFFNRRTSVDQAQIKQRAVVPVSILERLVEARLSDQFSLLPDVQFPLGRTLHYSSPPPVRDDDFVLADLVDRDATGLPAAPGMQGTVAPAWLRLAAWELNRDATKSQCERRSIRFCPPPAAVLDSGGFLSSDCLPTSGNSTHANRRYGEHLLRDLEFLDGTNLKHLLEATVV